MGWFNASGAMSVERFSCVMRVQGFLLFGLLSLLLGCSSRYQAPVDQLGEPRFIDSGRMHRVNEGETLYVIAWMYDLDFAALARVNNLREPYVVTPGEMLTVDLRSQPASSRNSSSQNTSLAATSRTNSAPGNTAVTAVNPVQVTGTATVRRSPLPSAGGAARPSRTPLPDASTTAPSAQTTMPAPAQTTPLPPPIPTPAPEASTVPPATPPAVTTNTLPPTTGVPAITAPLPSAPSIPTESPPSSANQPVVWAWPHAGSIVGRFSEAGSENKGIDISGNQGDAVLAAADGEVVYAGSGLLHYGNLIIIKHSDRFLSAYAHNRALVVSEKERVTKGQKIAELGSSGIDKNLLHFEIRVDGKPSDPLQYLPPR
jgi:lipoprotein NlpD